MNLYGSKPDSLMATLNLAICITRTCYRFVDSATPFQQLLVNVLGESETMAELLNMSSTFITDRSASYSAAARTGFCAACI